MLQGKCWHAAMVLANLTGGQHVRGFYHGEITRLDGFLRLSLEPDGSMQHSWVEKDGKILDPTWWAFTNAPLKIYTFAADDPRYRRTK